MVTTAGGVEEDFIKCLAPTRVLGDWRADGKMLRERGMNRIGNLVVPNDNYCKFEEWIMPILDAMLDEQQTQVINICKFIDCLGRGLDAVENDSSIGKGN